MAPSTQWKENIDPDEAVRLEKYAEILHAIQKKRDAQGSPRRTLRDPGPADDFATRP
jgi:hypothetical protein